MTPRPAAATQPPAFGGPDAAGPELATASRPSRTTTPVPPATTEPGWRQKPMTWVIAAVVVLIILFWLL
jgi:hypothetical protein